MQAQSLMGAWRGWEGPLTLARGKQAWELVPTWQQGQVVLPDTDYRNLVQNGYQGHALIHACVSLLASSAAVPPLMVLVKDEVRPEHRLAQLLARPNERTTGLEFTHLLLTHLLVTGNAYIELARSGANLVTGMGMLRADRVAIRPGATPDEDVFDYTVSADNIRHIPAADIIHIKLPNPGNDFYGLSPISVLAREGNLDIDLTELSKAFFTNGGIPMGMMVVEGRKATREEKKDIKSAWKRAFNRAADGTRKFFELLVMNASEAKYQQLGLPLKDLEMPGVRELTESRICMPFRVPPIMVGALVGMEHATYANYEAAEKALWRYGVTYYLEIVRARLQAELAPEFRAAGQGPVTLKHDLAGVPALVEDNVEKVNAAAGLVRSGGYTVNQANAMLGLPAVEGGDIYIRAVFQDAVPLNAPVERTVPIARDEPKKQLAAPPSAGLPEAKANRLATVLVTLRARHAAKMKGPLKDYFADQATAVGRNLRALLPAERRVDMSDAETKLWEAFWGGRKALRADELLPKDAEATLKKLLAGHWQAIDESMFNALAPILGIAGEYDAANPVAALIERNGSARVVDITKATKKALNDQLALAEQRGYGLWDTANGVPADGFPGVLNTVQETYKNRHLAIARTEAAIASNDAALARYVEAGVTEVDIIDGVDDEPCASRNGTRVPISTMPELAHPNGTLVILPVIE